MTGDRSHDYISYSNWKQWSDEGFGRCHLSDALSFRAELVAAGVEIHPSLRVLELGFGNAQFAAWAKTMGLDYVGTECQPVLLHRAEAMGIRAIPHDVDLLDAIGKDQIDLIVAFDVLEHLDIRELLVVLDTCRSLLRPNGLLIARVPSGDSPFSGALIYGDITHRSVLGSQAIEQLATRTGFTLEAVGPPKLPLRGLGSKVATRRLLVQALRYTMAAVINLAYRSSSRPLVVTPNLVFVMRKS